VKKFLRCVASAFIVSISFSPTVQAAESSNYVVGAPCTLGEDPNKPAHFYCHQETKVVKVERLLNKSGRSIPAGSPVSSASKEDNTLIRMANSNLDEKIIGISKDTIPDGMAGEVWLGDGNPNCCNYSDENAGRRGQLISNFDTSKFKRGETLYVGEDGNITNIRPQKVLTVGKVSWVGIAEPESYTLDIGQVPTLKISTWQTYAPKGSPCGTLTDEQIAPELRCIEDTASGNWVLELKNTQKTLGDRLYDKTGFNPDANSWGLILICLFLVGLIYKWVKETSNSGKAAIGKTLLFASLFGFVIFSIIAVVINVIQPFLNHNPINFSKKIFGIPQYIYLLPSFCLIILRNRK